MKLNSILVLLNYPRPKGLLKVAAELAQKTGAELKAVYLEDPSWFEVSSFSFSKQISGFRGEILHFSEEQLAQQSQALAVRFEKNITSYSRSLNIKYSYRTLRGYDSDEFASLVNEIDLFIMSGNLRQAEYWNKLFEQLAAPALVWDNGSYWPREVIGLCTAPEQSTELVRWTIQLGQMMNCRARLYWDAKSVPSLDQLDDIYEAKTVDSVLLKKIKDISEIYSSLSVDFLRHFRNALLVIPRGEMDTETLLQKLPNSTLLL